MQKQLAWYREQFANGELKHIRESSDLPTKPEHAIGTIILLEGGDAIRSRDDVQLIYDAGVRIVRPCMEGDALRRWHRRHRAALA